MKLTKANEYYPNGEPDDELMTLTEAELQDLFVKKFKGDRMAEKDAATMRLCIRENDMMADWVRFWDSGIYPKS